MRGEIFALNETCNEQGFFHFLVFRVYRVDKYYNYIVFYLAESKIPNTRFFNRSDVIHSQFIFGYEEKDHIFYLMNFGISEKLEIIKLKFEDLLVALEYTINLNGKRKNLQSTTMRDQGKDFRLILLKA